MKLALAMICKGSDEEAQALLQSLSFNAKHVDGIFITITHKPGEERNQLVEEACKLYGATISDFEWCHDFAKARNFNFSQVPKEYDYILWCDADDAIRDLDKLKPTIEAHPADTYAMSYMYAFDEQKNPTVVHQKSQVIKNDNCVEWVGRLHEDFKELRAVTTFFIKGIERIHLSNPERHEVAKQRNLEIALQQLADNPNDPRSYWNVGNAHKALQHNDEALEYFEKFLKTSKSDEEKYIVRLRIAETLWHTDKKQEGIENCQFAIGLKPNYPDAYFLAGALMYETHQYQKAAEFYMTGLVKPRPYYSIIVYNPREYDYAPMMNLAKVYFALQRPDLSLPLLEGCSKIYPHDKNLRGLIKTIKVEVEKFKEVVKLIKKLSKITDKEKLRLEMAKIPEELQAHPGICNLRNINFLKETSTGKDMVIYCGFTEEKWTPETIKEKGIGGSEEAVFHLSNRFAEMGWNVTVYNNCGHEQKSFNTNSYQYNTEGTIDVKTAVVHYKPFWMWNYRDRQDVVIIWRTPLYCDYEINSPKIYVDMHDVIPKGEFTPQRLERITKVLVKSQFQRDLFPNIPDEQIRIIPNGIVPDLFEQEVPRNEKLVINTSAPDRGISTLTKMWPKILAAVPDAKCLWAYGWGTFDVGYRDDVKVMEWKTNLRKEMRRVGVEELGRINHRQVANLYLSANVWAYPTGFGEIDCISATKALAAGAIPVAMNFAALKEKSGHGGFFFPSDLTPDTWAKSYQFDFASTDETQIEAMIQKIIDLLKTPPSEEARQGMRNWAKENYSWDSIAARWSEELNS